jgi:hypothetical protein
LYDWIALLWAAFDEAPGKEWLANVNYRRAFFLFQTARTCLGQEWFELADEDAAGRGDGKDDAVHAGRQRQSEVGD